MISSANEVFNEMTEYVPPEWCRNLKCIPKYRIPLAMKPTPIHRWNIEGIPKDVQLFVKRDDLTGSVLSGNKCRKLEFLLAEAKSKGCSSVITCGALQSNQCRCTVIAARQVGLDCHLIQRDRDEGNQNGHNKPPSGNLLLIRIGDPTTYLLPWDNFKDDVVNEKLREVADHIFKTTGKSVYCIPSGGSNEIGMHGYLYAWEEMMQQGLLENFDDIVVTCGSGGTSKGLAIANYLTGSKLRVHTISVCDTTEEVHEALKNTLEIVGLGHLRSEDLVDVCGDYIGKGYGLYDQADIAYSKHIMNTTGIYCDPIYVGKAMQALVNELNVNQERFQGKRILFIHTGGIFGAMEDKMAKMFQLEVKNKTKRWEEVFPDD